jgi:hypothetical protein
VNNGEDQTDDITAHVPRLLESTIKEMAFSSAENMLFACAASGLNTTRIYAYKVHWENNSEGREKAISSWSYWRLPFTVVSVRAIDEFLYALLYDSSTTRLYMVRMDLRDGATYDDDWDWEPLLDFRIARDHADVTTQFSGGNTTVTLPFRWSSNTTWPLWALLVDGDDVETLTPTSVDNTTGQVVFNGVDYSSAEIIFGLQYSALLEFTPPVVRRPASERQVAIPDGELILLFWAVNYADSGRVRGRVTLPDGTRRAYTHLTAESYAKSGDMTSGKVKFPVRVSTKQPSLVIDVINDRPWPSWYVNAGWEANFVLRSRPV